MRTVRVFREMGVAGLMLVLLSPPCWGEERPPADQEPSAWQKALATRAFSFPRDHGSHPEYRIEWWYYTGNLETNTGRRFGYQLTFFRTGLQPQPANPSRWAVRDLYTAHFAVSDIQNKKFTRFERTHRAGIGWAGAEENPGRIWNGEWELRLEPASAGDPQRHHLVARENGFAIDLTLEPVKPLVLHGDGGLSRKGPSEGNASYYYSFPRLKTTGTIQVAGESWAVEGTSWMDHEFSSSFLESGQTGWDWFSVQLDDGRELMLYQIRRENQRVDQASSGTLVAADGQTTALTAAQFQLKPRKFWRSPATGGHYPIAWEVAIPEHKLQFEVRAVFPAQEMDTRSSTGIVYWEGSVDIAGTANGQVLRGRGYLEMTGYAGQGLGRMLP